MNFKFKRDLTGQRFGKLVVLGIGDRDKRGHGTWRCACDCGAIICVPSNPLTSGNTTSCSCKRNTLVHSLVGKLFGALRVIKYERRPGYHDNIAVCICVCGNEHRLKINDLVSGDSKSCGCLTNHFRRAKRKNKKSQYVGVLIRDSKGSKRQYLYQGRITVDYKQYYIGSFGSEIECAIAVDEKMFELCGYRPNFPNMASL